MVINKETVINVYAPAKFHVYYLARELALKGYNIRFYTCMRKQTAIKHGMPSESLKSIFSCLLPLIILERKVFNRSFFFKRLRTRLQDSIMKLFSRKADMCISTSGGFVNTLKKQKKKGALIIIHRGSKHILEQKHILESIPSLKGKEPVPEFNVKRELSDYETADHIVLQTQHVLRSFIKHNFPIEKLTVIPTGVDLSEFYPISNIEKEYDVIMVGGWSYRKGCDLIVDAIRRTGLRFLHVGGIVDVEFPDDQNFTHVPPVDQSELVNYYNKAKISLLPSREEGLAMVQAQAIACNLPLVGSPDSGAEDLKALIGDTDFITIIKEYTVESVINGINEGLDNYHRLDGRIYAKGHMDKITWEAYGKRYENFLISKIQSL